MESLFCRISSLDFCTVGIWTSIFMWKTQSSMLFSVKNDFSEWDFSYFSISWFLRNLTLIKIGLTEALTLTNCLTRFSINICLWKNITHLYHSFLSQNFLNSSKYWIIELNWIRDTFRIIYIIYYTWSVITIPLKLSLYVHVS